MRLRAIGIGTALAGMALLGSAPGGSAPTSDAAPELRGVVTASSVGPVRFGASMAAVRRWAGAPEFASPPSTSLAIPRHRPGTTVFGYHCEGFGSRSCHTLFAFANGRLTTFSTNSPLFRTTNGVRPGMDADEVGRRDPALHVSVTCPSWQGRKIPTLMISAPQGYAFTLHARAPTRPTVFAPSC